MVAGSVQCATTRWLSLRKTVRTLINDGIGLLAGVVSEGATT